MPEADGPGFETDLEQGGSTSERQLIIGQLLHQHHTHRAANVNSANTKLPRCKQHRRNFHLPRVAKASSLATLQEYKLKPFTSTYHLETQQSSVMDILQHEAANNLQWQRKEQQDGNTSGFPTPILSKEELTSTIFSLPHALMGLRQEQLKEITSLQEALTAAGHQEQLDNATKQDLERELFQTKTLIKQLMWNLKRETKAKAICVQPELKSKP
ncbi:hypothetical protein DPX16_23624 [Anabarilius grahami]|uniref:Uncharacterized protein n=1 Tax=Anabarilius grahami TaxID=495550 RepID=A0A3N0ZB04_ANAGA|nr:hypothetical protein DPX16_23624 [Anabarilius grahami]